MVQCVYEIWNEQTQEVLVDNLSFEEMAEQFAAYQEFFGECIVGIVRNVHTTIKRAFNAEHEYKQYHIDYFAQLQKMGNL